MAKKKGKSEKKTGWFGNTYIQHFRPDGSKSGKSEFKKTIFGRQYTKHSNDKGEQTGTSERKERLLGGTYTQKYKASGEKTGTSEKKTRWWGSTYTQHHRVDGSEADRTEHKKTWFGKKYVQRYGDDKPGLRESHDRTSPAASGSEGHSSADYQSAHSGLSRFWAIAFGWITGFIFIEIAGPAAAAVVTARHLSMAGRLGALVVFWLYAFGILVGVTVTGILSGKRQRAGTAAVVAIGLTLALGVLMALTATISQTVGAEVGSFAGTHWRGRVGRLPASLDIFSTNAAGALSARIHYEGVAEDLVVTRSPDGTLVLRGQAYRRERGTGPFALDTFYGQVSPDGRQIHGSLLDASQRKGQWSVTKLASQHVQAIPTTLPTFHVTVNYDQTMMEMIKAGKYSWTDANWMGEVGRDPLFTNRHGANEVEIVLVHFNREMRSEEAIRELEKLNLRPIEVAELLAFGATYPEKQVEYPIVALGSMYQGWSPSLDNRQMPIYAMVGRGLSLGGNRNGGDMWESSSRFAAVRN